MKYTYILLYLIDTLVKKISFLNVCVLFAIRPAASGRLKMVQLRDSRNRLILYHISYNDPKGIIKWAYIFSTGKFSVF